MHILCVHLDFEVHTDTWYTRVQFKRPYVRDHSHDIQSTYLNATVIPLLQATKELRGPRCRRKTKRVRDIILRWSKLSMEWWWWWWTLLMMNHLKFLLIFQWILVLMTCCQYDPHDQSHSFLLICTKSPPWQASYFSARATSTMGWGTSTEAGPGKMGIWRNVTRSTEYRYV